MVFGSISPVLGQTISPTISLSSDSVIAGDTITISGENWSGPSFVALSTDTGFHIATVLTDSIGSFSYEYEIPQNILYGENIIRASQPNDASPSDDVALATFFANSSIKLSSDWGPIGSEILVSAFAFPEGNPFSIVIDDKDILYEGKGETGLEFPILIPNYGLGTHSLSLNFDGKPIQRESFEIAPDPVMTLAFDSGSTTSEVQVDVNGLAPLSYTKIVFDNTILSEVISDESGQVSESVIIPSDSSFGLHEISVQGRERLFSSLPFTVLEPSISISSNEGGPNSILTITGVGIPNAGHIEIDFDGSLWKETGTDLAGNLDETLQIPSGLELGLHSITSVSSTGEQFLSENFLLLEPSFSISAISAVLGSDLEIDIRGFPAQSAHFLYIDGEEFLEFETDEIGIYNEIIIIPLLAPGNHNISTSFGLSEILTLPEPSLEFNCSVCISGYIGSIKDLSLINFPLGETVVLKFDDDILKEVIVDGSTKNFQVPFTTIGDHIVSAIVPAEPEYFASKTFRVLPP